MHAKTLKNSEVDAYSYIKDQLNILGWEVKNPARFETGEVYKQNECLSNLELKKVLERDMPEAVVKITNNSFWVLESKRNKNQADLDKAIFELKDQYAKKINSSPNIKCSIISAIAGNDSDGYLISNQFLHNGQWKPIFKNGFEKTSLLSREEIEDLIYRNSPEIDDRIDLSEEKYLRAAEKINEILHLSAINKSKRARFIAGIVLSFAAENEINLETKDTTILVKNVNSLIESVLKKKGKQDFASFICLQLPPNEENHVKYREAIVQSYRELKNLDIRSAMNSGHDVLGKFYEVFLKYGNGAKEIGIVLTPRHIAKFAAEVLDIKYTDVLFDPTCGTGGFLVAGFDQVKQTAANEKQLEQFKKNGIFGIEQEDDVVALALVNMIFRGDGRNNIKEGNCFNYYLKKKITANETITAEYFPRPKNNINPNPAVTKVMMNPPFALKKSDEKEYSFIHFALQQMEDGGLLFAIVPISVMVESASKEWRRNELLKNNTLLAVITLPEDLFNPSASVGTVGIFIKKGVPHNTKSKIFFGRGITDGFTMKKGKRLYNKNNANSLRELTDALRSFIQNQNTPVKNIPELRKVCFLDSSDDNLELVPEVYIDTSLPYSEQIQSDVDLLVRETASYIIRTKK